MNLPGRLKLSTLGDVLGALFREGATGVLELTEETGAYSGRMHRVHIVGGLVAHVESEIPTARLGGLLRRLGLLEERGLMRLEELLSSEPERLSGELLIEDGLLERAHLERALRVQRRERLERLYLLSDARLAFRVARSSAEAPVEEPLDPGEFLHGRPRSRERGVSEPPSTSRHDPVRTRALATLGLTESADRLSVQRAFRKIASEIHPDRFPTASPGDRVALMRRFAELTAAYHALVA
jgi:hypothetical protein